MKQKIFFIFWIQVLLIFPSWKTGEQDWILKEDKLFTFYYTSADKNNADEYEQLVAEGIKFTETFFNASYKSKFDVYVYPNRKSLDSAWRKDWNIPDLKSECWMVASGVAKRLDIISPKKWDTEACEHRYSDEKSTKQL